MYISDKKLVEKSIIPLTLEGLFRMHIKQVPDDKSKFDNAYKLINKALDRITKNPKVYRRAVRLEFEIGKAMKGWQLRKCYMAVTHIASALHEAGAVDLCPSTIQIVCDMNEIITSGYEEIDGIQKQDTSAAKAAPKIIEVMQDMGYFEDVEEASYK